MKKIFLLVLCLILLVSCTAQSNINVVIIYSNTNHTLAFQSESGLYALTTDEVFEPGQEVTIHYQGGVMESYPMQFSKIVRIKPLEINENKINLAVKILNDHHELSKVFEDEISLLNLELEGLTQVEANAFSYLVSILNESLYDVVIIDSTNSQSDINSNHLKIVFNETTPDTIDFEISLLISDSKTIEVIGVATKQDGQYQIQYY